MIVLEYFDPNVTFQIQLSDMGMIRSDKAWRKVTKYKIVNFWKKSSIIDYTKSIEVVEH